MDRHFKQFLRPLYMISVFLIALKKGCEMTSWMKREKKKKGKERKEKKRRKVKRKVE